MKKIIKLSTIALAIIFSKQVAAQDTLHLDFKATQVAPDKVIEDKIVAWGKTLNGKKQDINIVAYYHKGEFKKFAEQRLEEMFLSVNRKVRDLVNIKTQEAKKGEDHQRTRVDIIYWPEGSDAKSSKKKSDDKKSDAKVAKEDDKKDVKKEEKPKEEKKAHNWSVKKKEDEKPKEEKKSTSTKEEKATTTSDEAPKGKDAGKKKGDEGKEVKYDSDKYYLDSTYVNGVLKVTKRKKK